MKSDRFLVAIVAGIAVLVVAAFALAVVKPAPTYGSDDSAEGVTYNYLLALQRGDYPRAYGYLSARLKGYPETTEEFTADIRRFSLRLEDESVSFDVQPAQMTGDLAQLTVRETRFSSGGLFESQPYDNSFLVQLRREAGVWKITRSDMYWVWCWDDAQGCSAS